MVEKAYLERYKELTKWAEDLWRDTQRPEYEADVWYNKDRNHITLDMLNHVAPFNNVLALGAAMWVDKELLEGIDARSKLRTDLIQSDGIDIVVDACAMPFKEDSFDLVICRELIEHVIDGEKLMTECNRVLEVGGYLLLTTTNGYDFLPDGKYHLRAFAPYDFLLVHELCGFEVIDKRGNVPNIFYSLMPLEREGIRGRTLSDFKDMAERFRSYKDSYYMGTMLFVLSKKVKCL